MGVVDSPVSESLSVKVAVLCKFAVYASRHQDSFASVRCDSVIMDLGFCQIYLFGVDLSFIGVGFGSVSNLKLARDKWSPFVLNTGPQKISGVHLSY